MSKSFPEEKELYVFKILKLTYLSKSMSPKKYIRHSYLRVFSFSKPTIMASLFFPIVQANPLYTKTIDKIHRPKRQMMMFSSHKNLKPLFDDGYMTNKGLRDFHDAVSELLTYDTGPPRWFCPLDCGPCIDGSPLILFLPGLDGIGMGLFMHHKALGRFFEVRCMHVPFSDRTPYEELLLFVEEMVKQEHCKCEKRPIYLLGHSFGGCLALSIAARNPNIDLILVLTNPATSFGKSAMQTLLPHVNNSTLGEANLAILLLLSLFTEHQVRRGLKSVIQSNPLQMLDQLSETIILPLKNISYLFGKITNGTLAWKLKLLKSAANYTNSRLHAVKSEVLLFISGMDSLLPSRDEGDKLLQLLPKCKVHFFENSGHNIVMENGFHLCSIIKSSGSYRKGKRHDIIKDFLPLTVTEFHEACKMISIFMWVCSPAMYSTLNDRKIVRGLSGVPNEGPVLLVGNHMLLGVDMLAIFVQFLKEKSILPRGMGHPILFKDRTKCSYEGHHFFDFARHFGGVPVTHKNFFKLLLEKAFVLLYPGGSREALHRKNERYKLIWPDNAEFVRMAAKCGATIVPFASVGEDDFSEMVLDYDDIMSIPCMRNKIIEVNRDIEKIRGQDLFIPYTWPKLPGRYYYLFGKPVDLSGNTEVITDKAAANDVYLRIKSQVENNIKYLLEKRDGDVYRSIVARSLYQAVNGDLCQIPSFDP